MATRSQMMALFSRVCHHQELQPGRRRLAYSSRNTGFQMLSRRSNHFWSSSSSEESGVEVDPEAASSSSTRKQSVVDERKITQAAPDWLPLVPGSSYWVPSEDIKDRKPKVILPTETLTAYLSPCGWPVVYDSDDNLIEDVDDSEEDE